jgi:ABC-type microcin C transport system permease subunit YejB
MSDISEAISEAVESASESPLNSIIALLVAIIATFMAVCGVKAGNLGQAMAESQARMVNAWSYYQSKSTKQNLAEATVVQLEVQRFAGGTAMSPELRADLDSKIAKYQANVQRYEKEKNDIKTQAEGYDKQYQTLNVHDDQFDLSDAALSVSIALLGITALTKKKWLLFFAIGFMLFGAFFGLAGFFQWNVHPEALTGLLS